jgi:hypothetical protein
LLKSYGTQINTAAACKGISNCANDPDQYYFLEVSQVYKVLIKFTPKDFVTYLTFAAEIVTKELQLMPMSKFILST